MEQRCFVLRRIQVSLKRGTRTETLIEVLCPRIIVVHIIVKVRQDKINYILCIILGTKLEFTRVLIYTIEWYFVNGIRSTNRWSY